MNASATVASLDPIVGHSELKVFGLSSRQRLERQLARAGAPAEGRQVLLRADWVFDEAFVRGIVTAPSDIALRADSGEIVACNVAVPAAASAAEALKQGQAPAGVPQASEAELASSYNNTLRKREAPFLLPLNREGLPAIERRVFGGSYKGVTDIVTLYVWPRPAQVVTKWCALAGISPNQVTFASLILVLAAMAAFWTGHFLLGLAAAWPMTFLDTVDGKLARCTLQSSPLGNVFDHGIDLIHPPFWWWAWIVGLPAAGFSLPQSALVLTVIVAGYVLQRVEEGVFIAWFKIEMHIWQWFDSKFRLITARRNPNLIILSLATLLGRPDLGIVLVAWWTFLCLLVHGLRIIQAAIARRHGPLGSWLDRPA